MKQIHFEKLPSRNYSFFVDEPSEMLQEGQVFKD